MNIEINRNKVWTDTVNRGIEPENKNLAEEKQLNQGGGASRAFAAPSRIIQHRGEDRMIGYTDT